MQNSHESVSAKKLDELLITQYCQTSVLFLVPKGLRLTAFLVLALRLASA
jgi:hypothetical protein